MTTQREIKLRHQWTSKNRIVTVYDIETRKCLGVFANLAVAGKANGFSHQSIWAKVQSGTRVMPFKGLVFRFGVPICPHCNNVISEGGYQEGDDEGIQWRAFPK